MRWVRPLTTGIDLPLGTLFLRGLVRLVSLRLTVIPLARLTAHESVCQLHEIAILDLKPASGTQPVDSRLDNRDRFDHYCFAGLLAMIRLLLVVL